VNFKDITARSEISAKQQPRACPYRNTAMNICSASLFRMRIDPKQDTVCSSDDHFCDCALFLSKTLRAG
jgi:hypothetical protein